MSVVFESAPAKINLALHVTGQRDDGYHTLESLVVFAEFADELTASPAQKDELVIKGPFADELSSGQSNLVLKAVEAFRQAFPGAIDHGVHLELEKNLPVAAGIGGGSADAAAALRLMASMSQNIQRTELTKLALKIGADVPVCLYGQSCLVEGFGDIVKPVPIFPHCHLVLVNPLIPLSTADVFRHLKSRQNPGLPALPTPMDRVAMLGLWLEDTRNDLETTAAEINPIIGEIIMRTRSTKGCIAARMSGSGATVFGLYGSSAEAHQAAHDIRTIWPQYWVAAAPVITPV